MFRFLINKNKEIGLLKAKKSGINVKTVEELGEKFNKINSLIASGKEIPNELTTSFVTFPLSDDPYKGDW